jgi:hypothetical protein
VAQAYGALYAINAVVVLVEMTTLDGLKDADEIAKVPGVFWRCSSVMATGNFRLPSGNARL